MGFLGYQPERLVALRRAVAAALGDVADLRCADPAASEAMAALARVRARLEPWEPRLVAITMCGFGSPYRPVTTRDALPLDQLRPRQAWSVVHDPVRGPLPPLDPVARADEVEALLATIDDHLDDPDRARRLRELLRAVLHDDGGRRQLLALLGPAGFAAVIDRLARRFVMEPDAPAARAARLILGQLAAGLGRALRADEVDEAAYRAALSGGPNDDPYLLALVVRDGGLPTATTVRWAREVLARYSRLVAPGLGALASGITPATGELVLEALLLDAAAGRWVLATLAEPELLLGSHLDGQLRARFLATVTDPIRFPGRRSEELLTSTLGYLAAHPDVARGIDPGDDLHDWLGVVLAPWLLTLDLRREAPPWQGQSPADVVAWIAERPAAAFSLVQAIHHHAAAAMAYDPQQSTIDATNELAVTAFRLGAVIAAVHRGRLAWATRQRRSYDNLTGAVKFLVGDGVAWAVTKLVPATRILGPAIDWATGEAIEGIEEQLVATDVLHPPADQEEAKEAIEGRTNATSSLLLHLAAGNARARVEDRGPRIGQPRPPGPREHPTTYAYDVELWANGSRRRAPVASAVADTYRALAAGQVAGGAAPSAPGEAWLEESIDADLRARLTAQVRAP